ncbi:MAG TPA: ABC transporter substrate-binding protein [Actinomycetota bacterium]|nr:ABC transporter substrate-binding protein [Actinomycetota bacterium]
MTGRRAIAAACICAAAFAACTGSPGPGPGDGDRPPGATRGGTLTFALADDAGVLDPQLASQPGAFALIRATQRGLMAFPSSEDPAEAAVPVPDLAADEPDVSADGRTVTFTLRRGPSFGPPASRPVEAADVKAGIERLFVTRSPLATYFRVIVGAADFEARRAPSIAGIETPDARTIRFSLTAPANDLTWMLAHTAASAVPAGTPAAVGPKDLASSGPYRVERVAAGREIRLVRNDAWAAGSDPVRGAYVDEIVVRVGSAATADLTGDEVPVPAGAEGRGVDAGCLLYLFVRPQGPFAERNARAAISLAIDRRALVEEVARATGTFSATATVSLLPPMLAGATERPLPPGDAAEARRLLAGASPQVAFGREASGPVAAQDKAAADVISRMLAAAGIRTVPLAVRSPGSIYEVYGRGAAPMGLARWCPDWPGRGARTMIAALAGTGAVANYSGTSDATLDALVTAAVAETDPGRIAAQTAAAADRMLALVTIVPLAFLSDRVAVSPRVRGFVPHPFFVRGDPTNVWLEELAPSPAPSPTAPVPAGGASSIAVRYTSRVPTTNGGVS